jgi:hypothetical protein
VGVHKPVDLADFMAPAGLDWDRGAGLQFLTPALRHRERSEATQGSVIS